LNISGIKEVLVARLQQHDLKIKQERWMSLLAVVRNCSPDLSYKPPEEIVQNLVHAAPSKLAPEIPSISAMNDEMEEDDLEESLQMKRDLTEQERVSEPLESSKSLQDPMSMKIKHIWKG